MPKEFLRLFCKIFGHDMKQYKYVKDEGIINKCCRCKMKSVILFSLPVGEKLMKAFRA